MTSWWSSTRPPNWTTHLLWATCLYWSTRATLQNVTIDDTYGDALTGALMGFSPMNAWKASANCIDCKAHPDPLFALAATWHESAVPQNGTVRIPTALVEFEGSAVYVYCIIPDTRASTDGFPNMRFVLDGEVAGSYALKPPAGRGAYDYSTLVFASPSLSPQLHVLEISNGGPGSGGSILLLDYILYTTDTDRPVTSPPLPTFTPGSPSSVSTASIVPTSVTPEPSVLAHPSRTAAANILGIALGVTLGGGLLVTAALAWATGWYNRRKRQRRVAPSTQFMREIEAGDAPRSGGARSEPGVHGSARADMDASEGAGETAREPSSASTRTDAMTLGTADEARLSSGIEEVSR